MNDEERKKMTQDTFNEAAAGYDCDELRFFVNSAKHLVYILGLKGNERVLDVAAGTGHVAVEIARSLPQGEVIGVDFSDAMLGCARKKAQEEGLNNVRFIPMDMRALDFPDGSFDIVNCSYGIFFVPDMPGVVQHMASKVRPGGKLAVTTFYDGAFSPLYDIFLARLRSYGVDAPTPPSKLVSRPEQCAAFFKNAGLDVILSERKKVGYYLKDAEGWWNIICGAAMKGLLNRVEPGRRDDFRREHLAEIQDLSTEAGLWLEVEALYTIGIRNGRS